MIEPEQQRLIYLLYECNQHKKMIELSYSKLGSYLPFNEVSYKKLDLDIIGYIDQFLFRFSKLQDTMGEKLFTTLLFMLGEDYSSKSMIDVLNRLEKLGLIDRVKWISFRKIRNEVAHEYSLNVGELVDNLNAIFEIKDELINCYDVIFHYCAQNFDFIGKNDLFLNSL